jgi:hypothetical protein
MFGSGLSPQLEGAVEAFVIVLVALILFLIVKVGQGVLEEVQDSMSEIERGKRLGAQRKKGIAKKKGPSTDPGSKEVREWGKDALGEKREERGKEAPKKKSLYPVKELEALGLDGSDSSEELSPTDEEDLEEEAARYEEERYYPDERQPSESERKSKRNGSKCQVVVRSSVPSAPPPYVENFHSDSFIPRDEWQKLQQVFPVFEAVDGGCIHASVEHIQIKELAELVRNYGVSANFTLSQVERLATLAMTPGDWQMVAKPVLTNMGQYLEWKALWYDASQTQARANAAAEGDQRNWTFDLLTGQGQYAANQTNYNWGAYAQVSAAAIKVWKSLSRKEEAGGHLTKIIQGPQESFSEFVARMMDAAGESLGIQSRQCP